MTTPDYQAIMLPLLKFAASRDEYHKRAAIGALADQFELSDEERMEMLPSGQQSVFDNRVGWAHTYLKKAGLLQSTKRSHYRITPRGLDLIATDPKIVDNEVLSQYPEFIEFRGRRNGDGNRRAESAQASVERDSTPEEVIEEEFGRFRDALASELLQQVLSCDATFFERLVVDLLVRMGYGGTRKDAGEALGRSGDGGIDGIIKEDRLGLDIVYIQAKRWKEENVVSRPEIQKFAGALQGQRARKGVFITTARFSREARDYVKAIDSKIVLIDGERLVDLMIDMDLGVSTVAKYELKRIDTDFFDQG